jgi:hypothetical protein
MEFVNNILITFSLPFLLQLGGVIPPGATLYFTMELVGIGVR